MQIINRLFPYPVLSIEEDDYIKNDFSFEIDNITEEDEQIKIKYEISLNNSRIISGIDNNEINLCLHVECPSTNFRNLITLNEYLGTISIESKYLNDRLDLCMVLVANSDMVLNREFLINSDYGNQMFEIKRGFIMGYYNADRIIINKEKDELFKPSSVISVVKMTGETNKPFDVNLDDDKRIKIKLDEENYGLFCNLQNNINLPILHGIIILPALVFVVDRLKSGDRQTYEDKSWYQAIEKQLEILGIEIDGNEWSSSSSIVIAQMLLKLPVNKALFVLSNGGE